MTESTLLIALSIAALAVGAVGMVLVVVALGRLGALGQARQALDQRIEGVGKDLAVLRAQGEDLERDLKQDFAIARSESADAAQRLRGEVSSLTQRNDEKLESIRLNVEQRLDMLRSENAAKLEQMRVTVDDKLQSTLESRLGESFKLVSDRLDQVHRGLGEMQSLAVGVGDLKRVLTNVKSRGTWGEVQLGALLAEVLTPLQFEANVETVRGSNKRVEFAIRLPGRDGEGPVWLPVDAKFPLDDWQRLQDALERADAVGADQSRKSLADFLKLQARTIRECYVAPPQTTDFAILFVPVESLFAEMMARVGFAEQLQRDHRVVLAGPANFLALLNSLQMGFRTLAIEQRSSEVWELLRAVKTEFGKFGDVLAKTKERIDKAGEELERAGVRSRAIARELRKVEALPEAEAARLIEPGLDAPEPPHEAK